MTLPPPTPSDRRTFLRRFGALALGVSTLPVGACRPAGRGQRRDRGNGRDGGAGDVQAGDPDVQGAADSITRPLLLPWSQDIVRIAAPSAELPVAYVSMALRQVFVDHDFRDRASWLLDAHISVSTGHWRIPLPGDPRGQPIPPGDALREFEELAIHQWDSGLPPAMDDIRIRRGLRVTRGVHFECVPLAGEVGSGREGRWYSGGPWKIDVCDGTPVDTTREDFMLVGDGVSHRGRQCDQPREKVQYVTWACRGRDLTP